MFSWYQLSGQCIIGCVVMRCSQRTVLIWLQVTRLDSQVTRYKSASEDAEKAEEELKVEKRRLQREVTDSSDLCWLRGVSLITASGSISTFCMFTYGCKCCSLFVETVIN